MFKRRCAGALGLAVALWVNAVSAAELPPLPTPAKPAPGMEIAQTISMITGVAISPLLGVGAVGAWKYLAAPAVERHRLPWFARPWFWIPALLLVGAVAVKDLGGPLVPITLKKPFDVAEAVENKVSGLVAAGAFVPLVAAVFPVLGGDGASLAEAGFAAVNWGSLANTLLTPFAIIAFLLVWLAAHSINVLILISPFASVDLALKAFRTFVLSTVTFTAFAHPYVGAVWAAILIVFCWCIAGWSFRVAFFGGVFIGDILIRRRRWFQPAPDGNWAFTARKVENVPVRTYGRLSRNAEGRLELAYRPWLVLAGRKLTLPAGDYVVGRGIIAPELLATAGDDTTSLLRFPPRYKSHEQVLVEIYALREVREIGWLAVWRWVKELFGVGTRPALAPAQG